MAINSLAASTGLNGMTTGQISNLYPSLIAPANYVFSIWGIIYILLATYIIYQALPTNRSKLFNKRISYLFILSCITNTVWLLLWHYRQTVISVFAMFVLLGTLIAIYLRLGVGKSNVPLKEKIAVHLPFSVYLGWITVASIANVADALLEINWNGWGISNVVWTNLVIIVALAITLTVLITRVDVAYALVIIWALIGVIFNPIQSITEYDTRSIVWISEISIIMIAILGVWVSYGLASKRGVKEPDYKIIERKKAYEIREYSSYTVAEVEIEGSYENALNKGFNILASYIFGNNVKKEEIKMTAPVTYQPKSEKIDMTTPVIQEVKGKKSIISFVMPIKYTLETLPVPNDKSISFRLIEQKRVAVNCFNGYGSQKRMLRAQKELEDSLKKNGIETISSFRYAQYNPPFTPPFMRRNEVMVDVK